MNDDIKRIERLTIERMAYGADAIAHDSCGKTVFVLGAVPGDVIEARFTSEEKSYSRAVIHKVLDASPSRVKPKCPYANVCGGCPWASIARNEQLRAKRTNVVDALVRIGHLDAGEAESLVSPCESPSPSWGYRNKVELAFERKGNRAMLGMHTAFGNMPGKSIIKINQCELLDSKHKRLVKSVSGALGYLTGSHGIGLDRVGIRASSRTNDVEVALWTSPGAFPRAQAAKILGDACKASSTVRVLSKGKSKARRVSGVEVLGGRGHWRERIGDNTMMLSAPSFFQVNTLGAERLVELVLESLSPTESDEAMDLYCGAGTFTIPLAKHAGWVSAVEAYGPAVRDLRRNLSSTMLENVDAIGGDAAREFPHVSADVIVVDPPRAGLAPDVIDMLSAQPARAIAYVSCDPATLARDLARFKEKGAFVPTRITPVDLFPQTFHVETAVLLTRNK